ncbi:DUF2796 domain-containing protein [Amphritea sp.]|uniref:DUF2796 domain-containing protein n=1 Tax=Amphritea sp. TaxID=1872502 RepID=UPI0025B82CF6|nr:DUF2796 domain-containing protein [Amphritea sp.]
MRFLSGMLLLLTAQIVTAEGFERQLESHVHGKASMNVVLEGKELGIELKTPAANILGFEYAAETDQQKQALVAAVSKLKTPEDFILLSEEAVCQLVLVDVDSSLLGTDSHSSESGHEHEHEHEHEHGDEHEGTSHSDFELSYQFHCQNPKALRGFSLELFQTYPLMKHLVVQSISPAGQNYQELNADNRWVNL